MKFAYWTLIAASTVLVLVGHFADVDWLVFVAIATLLAAAALNPKRPLFGLRKSS